MARSTLSLSPVGRVLLAVLVAGGLWMVAYGIFLPGAAGGRAQVIEGALMATTLLAFLIMLPRTSNDSAWTLLRQVGRLPLLVRYLVCGAIVFGVTGSVSAVV